LRNEWSPIENAAIINIIIKYNMPDIKQKIILIYNYVDWPYLNISTAKMNIKI